MEFHSAFKLKYHLYSLLVLLLLGSCANPVAPTGGPKDVTPPAVTGSSPANLSTNFTDKEIVISFDEYVSLKDIHSQLIVSPPLSEMPTFSNRGKSLIVKFKDQWRSETTYNIFFGDAIVDITEGNKLGGYKFTFSTGDVLDSMMIEGKLINAFNLVPVKDAYVMLYDSIYDSVPYKQIPYYISRTNESGEFRLTNLRNMKYKMFALTDVNANYIYDVPGEEIAFIDTLISPWMPAKPGEGLGFDTLNPRNPDTVPVPDSVVLSVLSNDSLAITDTIPPIAVVDSVAAQNDSTFVFSEGRKYIQMFHFREVDSTQNLLKYHVAKENVLNFIFKVPVKEPVFRIMEGDYTGMPVIVQNRIGDTLTMWLPGYTADSIWLEIADQGTVIDTVEMMVKPREKTIRKSETVKSLGLALTNNIMGGRIKPTTPLRITFADPVTDYSINNLLLMEDTLVINNARIEFNDSIQKQLIVKYPWKEGVKYTLAIPDSTFTSILNTANDSLQFSFRGAMEEETSQILLAIELPAPTPYIIQLLDAKEKLVSQISISESMTVDFRYISPGKYKIKAIDDRNGNGYWDTGKYLAGRYPERVIYFSTELDLRANWTVEEQWNIPEPGK
jgi:hypothetical protein